MYWPHIRQLPPRYDSARPSLRVPANALLSTPLSRPVARKHGPPPREASKPRQLIRVIPLLSHVTLGTVKGEIVFQPLSVRLRILCARCSSIRASLPREDQGLPPTKGCIPRVRQNCVPDRTRFAAPAKRFISIAYIQREHPTRCRLHCCALSRPIIPTVLLVAACRSSALRSECPMRKNQTRAQSPDVLLL